MTKDEIRSIADLAEVKNREEFYPNPNFPNSIYYKFFELLTAEMKPNLSIELGINGGGGSLHLAKGWPQGTVIGMDIAWDCAENIKHIRDNFPNFIFMLSDSISASKYVFDTYGPIDVLFIDTIHTYERTLKEFHTYLPYLSDNAIVCLDDLFRPGMDKAWDEVPGEKMRLDFLHSGSKVDEKTGDGGFGVVWNIPKGEKK